MSHVIRTVVPMHDDTLTDLEKQILDFAKQTWNFSGAKETAIREQFGISPTRFYQRLEALVDRPAALVYAPSTVHRLQRLRRARRAG